MDLWLRRSRLAFSNLRAVSLVLGLLVLPTMAGGAQEERLEIKLLMPGGVVVAGGCVPMTVWINNEARASFSDLTLQFIGPSPLFISKRSGPSSPDPLKLKSPPAGEDVVHALELCSKEALESPEARHSAAVIFSYSSPGGRNLREIHPVEVVLTLWAGSEAVGFSLGFINLIAPGLAMIVTMRTLGSSAANRIDTVALLPLSFLASAAVASLYEETALSSLFPLTTVSGAALLTLVASCGGGLAYVGVVYSRRSFARFKSGSQKDSPAKLLAKAVFRHKGGYCLVDSSAGRYICGSAIPGKNGGLHLLGWYTVETEHIYSRWRLLWLLWRERLEPVELHSIQKCTEGGESKPTYEWLMYLSKNQEPAVVGVLEDEGQPDFVIQKASDTS